MKKVMLLLSVFALLANAKPQIKTPGGVHGLAAVSNAAILARGSAFAIEGSGLGPDQTLNGDLPYPNDLGGVSVTLAASDGSGTVQAIMAQAGAKMILAIVPSATPAGEYNVTVTFNGESSDPVKINVADRNFGLLTDTGRPGGAASARIRIPDSDPVPVKLNLAAKAGQTQIGRAHV